MNNSNMIMYTTEDGLTKIEVTFDEDTVWLSLEQMAELFQRDKSTISRHIKNIFAEGELRQEATKVASVNRKGVVRGKAKGMCWIYCVAQDGCYKKSKVTVK